MCNKFVHENRYRIPFEMETTVVKKLTLKCFALIIVLNLTSDINQ